jgi:hypothetical protein
VRPSVDVDVNQRFDQDADPVEHAALDSRILGGVPRWPAARLNHPRAAVEPVGGIAATVAADIHSDVNHAEHGVDRSGSASVAGPDARPGRTPRREHLTREASHSAE